MKVVRLEMNDYRGITNLEFSFGQSPVLILAGVNGVGKSAVLDCLAVLLSRLIWRIRSTSAAGRVFTDSDISNGRKHTRNTIVVRMDDGADVEWSVTRWRSGSSPSNGPRQPISHLVQVNAAAENLREKLEADPGYNLPLAVYYPVNRAVLDIPLRIRTRHEFESVEAYDQALGTGRSDFRLFFEWFRAREDLENELRLRSRKSFDYKDRLLSAVRRAIVALIPGFQDLRIERVPHLQMVITKGREEVVVNQLSDGEKCLLAMVGDLARRLSIANPSLEDPLNGSAVVLIDEIELHLHPGWQRMVIPALERTFPNCQFIVSTHSPQVLADVRPEGIYLLERKQEEVTASQPGSSYGRDSSRILEDLMQVSARPLLIKDELSELFRLIDDGKLDEARTLRSRLEQQIGPDEPEFARADILIRRSLVRVLQPALVL